MFISEILDLIGLGGGGPPDNDPPDNGGGGDPDNGRQPNRPRIPTSDRISTGLGRAINILPSINDFDNIADWVKKLYDYLFDDGDEESGTKDDKTD